MWLLVCCLHGRRSRRRRSGPPLASLVRNSRCMMSFITRIRIFSERCLWGDPGAGSVFLPDGHDVACRIAEPSTEWPPARWIPRCRIHRHLRVDPHAAGDEVVDGSFDVVDHDRYVGWPLEPQWIAVIGPAGVQAERLTVEEFRAPISSTEKLATTPTSRAWLPPTRTVPIDKERDAVSVSARSENQRAR